MWLMADKRLQKMLARRMVAVRNNGEAGVLGIVKVEPRFVRCLGCNVKEKKKELKKILGDFIYFEHLMYIGVVPVCMSCTMWIQCPQRAEGASDHTGILRESTMAKCC